MPLPTGFDPVPGPPEERFSPARLPDRKRGPGDLARDDITAEKARAAHDALVAELQSKQIPPVRGDFTPEMFPGFGIGTSAETVWLEGGPLSDRPMNIRRGSAIYNGTAADGAQYVPADYVRTKRLSNEGLVIFKFKPAVAV
jgi:hypothetical protein